MRGRFANRVDAGRRLAEAIEERALPDPVVLGLPRGGVPVAFEVAERLRAPLDVLIVRKVGAPHHRELAIGAIAEDGEALIDTGAAGLVGADQRIVDELVRRERSEIERSVSSFRSARPQCPVEGRDVVVVDDGLATGLTAEAAIRSLRRRDPRTITLGVPVGARSSVERLRAQADDVVCVLSPENFLAVGLWYQHFDQTSDEEVLSALTSAQRWRPET